MDLKKIENIVDLWAHGFEAQEKQKVEYITIKFKNNKPLKFSINHEETK